MFYTRNIKNPAKIHYCQGGTYSAPICNGSSQSKNWEILEDLPPNATGDDFCELCLKASLHQKGYYRGKDKKIHQKKPPRPAPSPPRPAIELSAEVIGRNESCQKVAWIWFAYQGTPQVMRYGPVVEPYIDPWSKEIFKMMELGFYYPHLPEVINFFLSLGSRDYRTLYCPRTGR